jgi:hypothetical protein
MVSKRINILALGLLLTISFVHNEVAALRVGSFLKGSLCIVPILGPNLMRWVAQGKTADQKRSMYYGYSISNFLVGLNRLKNVAVAALMTGGSACAISNDEAAEKALLVGLLGASCIKDAGLLGLCVWDQTRVNRDFEESFKEDEKDKEGKKA